MATLQFDGKIEIRDGNPYVLVSKQQATDLKAGWHKPMPVRVQVNGQPQPAWRINMMPAGDGSFYLYLHGDVRTASKTKVGDTVHVSVRFDASYRSGPTHPMPASFKAALARDATVRKNWEALIPSRQKEMLRYIASLKSPEAVERNVQKALQVLGGKPARFMARSWKDGS